MARRCMSLREIARKLDIPPSTVASYKDRFGDYIPFERDGHRRVYPPVALDIVREIRRASERMATTDEVERHIAAHYADILAAAEGACQCATPDFTAFLSRVVERMSCLLRRQCEGGEGPPAQAEDVEALREEVAALRKLAGSAKGSERRIRRLREQNSRLKAEKRELEQLLLSAIGTGATRGKAPPSSFLDLPLVIRSSEGEFLGVLSRGRRRFNVRKFLTHVRRGAGGGRTVKVQWTRGEDHWRLAVQLRGSSGEGREYVMHLTETLTPMRNIVACLGAMAVDGQEVPARYMVDFFRRIRDEFA